jgi:Xaa-Pro aminopeptidase
MFCSQLELAMTQNELKNLMNEAQPNLGGGGSWCLVLLNVASAFLHGSKKAQVIKSGSIVLMDSGFSVHGYQSDISLTLVFGSASKKQRKRLTKVSKLLLSKPKLALQREVLMT